MDIRNNILNRLDQLIREIPEKIMNLQDEVINKKPAEDKWSKKEILGHLCDSAVNNLCRFVMAQMEPPPYTLTGYDQDKWVLVNFYGEMKTEEIVNYWVTLNRQIVRIAVNIPEDKLAVDCILGNAAFREGETVKSLLWVIEDYLVHMEYHLRQIIEEERL